MLNLTLDQYEYAQYDFGTPTNLKLYKEDKKTLFDGSGYSGVIQSFKRHGDGSFFPFRDVARGLAVMGFVAQIISDVDINFTVGNNTGTFTWTNDKRPAVLGFIWLKAVLHKGPLSAPTELLSSNFIRIHIPAGAPV